MKNRRLDRLVKVSILGAISAILMNIKFPLPFAPPFMTVDFADVASLIGGFAMGPMAGVLVVLVKNIIKLILFGSNTMLVGELSNFIVGGAFVWVAAMIYKREKTHKGAIKGMIFGSLVMTLLAVLSNAFLIFPLYRKMMATDISEFVKLTSGLNSLVNSYLTLMIFAIVPFNLVKSLLVSIVTQLLYKRVSPILKYEENK